MEQENQNYKKKFLESDSKFETLFELTSSPSKIINSDLLIIRVNEAFTDLLGFTSKELEGTTIIDHACPEYVEQWQHLQAGLWTKKFPFFKLEVCLIKKDKSVAWVSATSILFEEDGEIFGFTILDDLTAKKQLEESERRLNIALQYSKTAVWEMNLNDFSVIRSDSHDEIFGYNKPLNEWNKEHYLQHLVPEDLIGFEDAVKTLISEGVIDYKGRIYTVNKAIKWLHLQGKVEYEQEGKTAKVIGTIKDITREKIAEQHKDEFISTVSHELKTPITSIKAQTQLLERKFSNSPDVGTATMLKRINLQINRLATLVSDLLEAGRIEEDSLLLRKEKYKFNEMVDDITAELQRTTSSHQISIANNPLINCFGDRERIGQVLSNLLTNAIKYSPGQNKVVVSVENPKNQIICSVQDFGLGIYPNRQPHIFERFYRIPADNNYVISGFGLGLYISAEIIKKMKGKIWLTSNPGEGSIFYFSIPCEGE